VENPKRRAVGASPMSQRTCHHCRRPLGEFTATCPCGTVVPTDTPESSAPASVSCPKCRSVQVTASDKGIGVKKAVVGGLLLGPLGLLAGMKGRKTVMVGCMKCGHRWEAGKG
jgi:hypothetical protein